MKEVQGEVGHDKVVNSDQYVQHGRRHPRRTLMASLGTPGSKGGKGKGGKGSLGMTEPVSSSSSSSSSS